MQVFYRLLSSTVFFVDLQLMLCSRVMPSFVFATWIAAFLEECV